MEEGLGVGGVVDDEAIASTVIFDMVPSRKRDIGDGRMTSNVVVFDVITSDIVAFNRLDIDDDGKVTCGVVVSRIEGKGDGRLVDGGVVSSVVTLEIMASMRGNRGNGRVVNGEVVSNMIML